MERIFSDLRQKLRVICQDQGLLNETITIRAKPLTPEEAIGNPEARDFPLHQGKERLMQAALGSGKGQAFTDQYGDYTGTLAGLLDMDLANNFRRAIFVASLNAVLDHLGLVRGTIHCRDQGPTLCAPEARAHVAQRYAPRRILQVGFQPCLVEQFGQSYDFRVLDLDQDNIGQKKRGVLVEGPEAAAEAMEWADLLLVTGTTLANGTIGDFLNSKPVVFYGTTIAGAAYLMGWDRVCPQSS